MRQPNSALDWFGTALRERSPFFAMFFAGDPRLDPLRGEQGFRELADAVSLVR
jgi:hypothetical protein